MKIVFVGGGELLLKTLNNFQKLDNVESLTLITSQRNCKEKLSNQRTFYEESLSLKTSLAKFNFSINLIKSINDLNVIEIFKRSDLIISISSPWIFNKEHISSCKRIINVHCTLLPQWRGGGGPSWMILSGIKYTAITIHEINEGLDTGNINFSKKFFLPLGTKTPLEFNSEIIKKCDIYLFEFIKNFIATGKLPTSDRQQEVFSSYFPRLNTQIHGCIDWSWSSIDLVRFIDAFDDPHCGAFTRLSGSGSKVFIKKARVVEGECNYHPFQAGIIFRKEDDGVYICTNGGVIYSSSVLDQNGLSLMDSIKAGDRFYSSLREIENARATKVIYSDQEMININKFQD